MFISEIENSTRVDVGKNVFYMIRKIVNKFNLKCTSCGRVITNVENFGLLKIENDKIICKCRLCTLSDIKKILQVIDCCNYLC